MRKASAWCIGPWEKIWSDSDPVGNECKINPVSEYDLLTHHRCSQYIGIVIWGKLLQCMTTSHNGGHLCLYNRNRDMVMPVMHISFQGRNNSEWYIEIECF